MKTEIYSIGISSNIFVPKPRFIPGKVNCQYRGDILIRSQIKIHWKAEIFNLLSLASFWEKAVVAIKVTHWAVVVAQLADSNSVIGKLYITNRLYLKGLNKKEANLKKLIQHWLRKSPTNKYGRNRFEEETL